MKLNRKGFTLVELLGIIIIIALVFGFSTYGIINVINNSKDKKKNIAESSIKDSARIYSSEASSDSWKKTDDYDAFCVTIGELINKGLLDNDGVLDGNFSRDDYVIVKRNKVTLAIEKEEITIDGDDNYRLCTGTAEVTSEEVTAPSVGGSTSYTDKIVVNFEPGSASYNGKDSTVTYNCLYGESSSNVNKEGKIVGNSCVVENLYNNHDYYIIIYMTTNNGSSVAADGNKDYKTSDFNKPTISHNKNVATITFNDRDTNGNDVINPVHYFKSDVGGISNVSVESCQLNNGLFTCGGTTTNISGNTWYRVSGTEVKITYSESNNDVKINASVYDGSNNHADSEKEFIIRKYTVNFYKGSAGSIDGSTNSYVTKSCIGSADKGSTVNCSIKSPSIVRSGYSIVGWSTSSNGTTSSWDATTIKSISGSVNYYTVTKKDISITFSANGATIGSTSQSCSMYNSATGCSVTSPTITRNGFTIVGWNTDSSATTSIWDANTAGTVTANATYHAITYKYVTITFNANGASIGATSGNCTIWNSATSCPVTSPSITRSGYTIVGWNTSSSATTSTWNVGATAYMSSNATYFAITRYISSSGGGSTCTASPVCVCYGSSGSTQFSCTNKCTGKVYLCTSKSSTGICNCQFLLS